MLNQNSKVKKKMSIFNWFGTKKPARATAEADRSGLEPRATKGSRKSDDGATSKSVGGPSGQQANSPKNGQEEQLRLVVSDSMIRAGVLGRSYKFKVLPHEGHGRQVVIMMDLAEPLAGDITRLAEIEALMAQAAKMRYDILITSVYWRMSEQVTAGLSPISATPQAHPAMSAAPQQPTEPHAVASPVPPTAAARDAASHQENVAAFKRSWDHAEPDTRRSAPAKIVNSRKGNPSAPADFEDTQMIDPDESAPH